MDFSSSLCVEISSEAYPSSGYQWSFPGGKAQSGSDADHSIPIQCRGQE